MSIKNINKFLFLAFFAILFLTGCNESKKDELDEILSKDNYIILDVRTNEEYAEGHIKDAINIPYDTIDDTTSLDKSKTILVYCRSGNRSKKATVTLLNLGYDVYDMGGIDSINLPKE